jgi:hypothetical protein
LITPNHTQLFNQLDKSKLDKVQIVRTPTATVCIDGDIIETKFGGYKAIVHYNRDKEIEHRRQRNNKRLRSLRKKAGRSLPGDELPPCTTLLDLGGRNLID